MSINMLIAEVHFQSFAHMQRSNHFVVEALFVKDLMCNQELNSAQIVPEVKENHIAEDVAPVPLELGDNWHDSKK